MSRYEWERGTITLPTAAVPTLKKTLRDLNNQIHDEVRAEAVRLHKDIAKSTRSLTTYRQRINDYKQQKWSNESRSVWTASRVTTTQARTEFVHNLAIEVIETMLFKCQRESLAPYQPKVADVDRVVVKKTNRDNTFRLPGTDGSIHFDGRAVTWSVDENNHAVESARESLLGTAFFNALSRIVWTRGTGGQIVGNDEYNQDSEYAGGGANYITDTFGPLGEDGRIQDYMNRGFSRAEAKRFVTAVR